MATKETTTKAADTDEKALPPRLRMKLATIADVRKELGRLYREARAGRVETQDASRLANMLSIMGRLIEGSDLEARIAAIEAHAQSQEKEGRSWATH